MNTNFDQKMISKSIWERAVEIKRLSLFFRRGAYIMILLLLFFLSITTYATDSDCNLFQSANKEKEAFRWDDALTKYKKLVEEYPRSPFAAKAHIQLGMSLKYQKRYDEAIVHYEQAIAKAGKGRAGEDAKTAIAAVYYFNGDFLKALGLFRQVLNETKDWDQVKYCSHFIREIKRRISLGNYSMSQCGPAALAKICEISNIKTSTQELAKLMDLDNRGASLDDLRKCAESKGLKAVGVKLTTEQLSTVKLPLIALLEPTHYVVVTALKAHESVEIIDPGKRNVSLMLSNEEFQKFWGGLALVFDSEEKMTPMIALLDKGIMKTSRGKICDCCPEGNEGGAEDNENVECDVESGCNTPGMPRITINTVTLNMVLEDIDFSYDGRGPRVEIKRTYNADSPKVSTFGNSWTYNYNTWLWEAPDNSVYLTRGSGKIDRYISAGGYIPPEGVYDNLVKNTDGTWSLKIKKEKTTHNFDANGSLTSILDRNGNAITLQYGNNPVLNPSLIWGANNYSGDEEFAYPTDVAIGLTGFVYVVDTENTRIQKFDRNGNFLSKWGRFGTENGEFDEPVCLATDASGFVYVVDAGSERIQKFDSDGNFITKWGREGAGNGEFDDPYGIAIDASGFVYISDTDDSDEPGDTNTRIQKFDSNGNFITKWGSFGSGDGEFNQPRGMAVDNAGNIYVADYGNTRIQKFDSNGNFLTKWGSGVYGPMGIITDNAGFVYVVNQWSENIKKYDSNGNYITEWGRYGSGAGNFYNPMGIAIASNGNNVYVADTGNKRIQKFTNVGSFVTKWGSDTFGDGVFNNPTKIAADNLGYVYVADTWNDRIQKFDGNGKFMMKWGGNGSGNGEFATPSGVAVDSAGYIYVLDSRNYRIQKFDSSGNFVTKWGSFGNGNGRFQTYQGGEIAIDSFDNIYVADSGNNRIQKFDSNGNFIMIFGSYGNGNGNFNNPIGVAVDNTGLIYVADSGNHRIQKFDSNGNFITKWGVINDQGIGEFDYPEGISVDGSGNVYVADSGNARIQKFDSNGNFLFKWGRAGSDIGEFERPKGVDVDSFGNGYIADSLNNRIVKFDTTLPFGFLSYPTSVTDAAGRTTSLTYAFGKVVKITGPDGRFADFTYDSSGNLISTTDMEGNTVDYTYDNNNYITAITTPKGTTTANYDTTPWEGYALTSLTNPDGITKTYDTADWSDVEIEIVDGKGNLTRYVNNWDSYTESITDALGNQLSYGYTGGDRTSITDANNHTALRSYDSRGNIISVTTPMGRRTFYEYDSNDNLTKLTYPDGNTIIYTYDTNDNLTGISNPPTTFAYNGYGELTSLTDVLGNITAFSYDAFGNLASITNALGKTPYTYGYDLAGRVSQVTDSSGNVTNFQYDGIDRINRIIYPIGNRQFTHECCGLKSETDEEGNVVQYTYKPSDGLTVQNLAGVTNPLGEVTSYGYDSVGNMTSATNPLGNSITYSYDNADRLVQDGEGTVYSYDLAENVLTSTDANGNTTDYTYDDDNRLIDLTYPDSSRVSFTYNANGDLASMVDVNGTTTYTYSFIAGRNRVISKTDPYGKAIQYGYDALGNQTSITYPDGKIVSYVYDRLNRLSTVTDWLGNTTTYTYAFENYLNSITYPNGVTTVYGYNSRWRLTSLITKKADQTVIASYVYTLDGAGNRIGVDKVEPLSDSLSVGVTTYTYDTDNKLLFSSGTTSNTFSYDNNGNLIRKDASGVITIYSYDYEDRLAQISKSGSNTQYIYDGLGNRIAKTVNGTTTRYVVDTNNTLSQILAETNSSGNITAYYIHGIGLAAKITPAGNAYYYHYDGLGSTIAMTGSSQSIANKYAYGSYGKILGSVEAVANAFKYVGKYGVMNEGSDFYFMRARYYDAEIMRFLHKDPLWGDQWKPESFNRYIYVKNNPLNLIDPLGLCDDKISWWERLFAGLKAALEALAFPVSPSDIVTTAAEFTNMTDKVTERNQYQYEMWEEFGGPNSYENLPRQKK